MADRKIERNGSDGLPPVINVTGKRGRSITILLGEWAPPEPTVVEGGPAPESDDAAPADPGK